MKRVASLWQTLPLEEKESFKLRCRTEFQEQRTVLEGQGIEFRRRSDGSCGAKPKTQAPEAAVSPTTTAPDINIGKFQCLMTEDGSCAFAGEGAYGAVLLSQTADGRKCVVKVFKHKNGGDDLRHEAGILHRLQECGQASHCLPRLLEVETEECHFHTWFWSMQGRV